MFDMENLNPSTRFYWGDSEKEWVNLRLAADDDTERLRKRAGMKMKTEYRRDNRTGRLNRIEFLDSDEDKIQNFTDELNDFIIADWHLETKTGEEIPCTKENKNKLIRQSPAFSEWVAANTEKLRQDTMEAEGREIKNFETTLSG